MSTSILSIMEACVEAVTAVMVNIRTYQLGLNRLENIELKSDQSWVSKADKENGFILQGILGKVADVSVHVEDGPARREIPASKFIIFGDSLDGTRAFMAGVLTSTVITGVYEKKSGRIVGCVVGEPISGRVWTATLGQGCFQHLYDFSTARLINRTQKTVWSGLFTRQCTIFLGRTRGFIRERRAIWTDNQVVSLMHLLIEQGHFLVPGSDGLCHALVASGGEQVVGAITAGGGPWDMCGALLVLEAGGLGQGFYLTQGDELQKCSPLDAVQAHVLVLANAPDSMGRLIDLLEDMYLS